MSTVYYYKIWCNTDSQYEYVWNTEEPTACPVNSGHSVNLNSISIEDEVSSNRVKIQEENIPTGENFMAECHTIDYATGPNVVTTFDWCWKFPITSMGIQLVTTEENVGDDVKLAVAPDTVIGVIGVDAATGATGATVSSTVIDNMLVGYYVSLFDGVNYFDCGIVGEVNSGTSSIVWENPLPHPFSASSPTYVMLTVYTINNFTLGPPHRYDIGQTKIGGSSVPANTIVRAIITNKSNYTKKITAMLEYLY